MSQLGHKRLFLGQCPFIPFSLSEDWNLITRTIVPLIDRQDFPIAAMNESGLGDIIASQFFIPEAADRRRLDLGRGTGRTAADGYRRRARRRK